MMITGVGFKPDWTWSKDRTNVVHHVLTDSSRGVHLDLFTSSVSQESNDTNGVTAFTADGFNLGSSTNHNVTNHNYVSWNWKANGGTTSSNTDGSATTTVQANTTAGFSIVLYTGTGSTSTFGHGLGAVPKWFFTKTRSNSGDWIVYHAKNTTAPETDFLKFNATNATEDLNTMYNDTAPTSTVFTLSTNGDVNTSGRTQVAYCFAEVEGYSKFGSYTGNGSTDGVFVYTGFRPAWIMTKTTTTTDNWRMYDNKRIGYNPSNYVLYPNLANVEDSATSHVDLLSNGFKARDGNINSSGNTYIYMAFAEQPFKYANAR